MSSQEEPLYVRFGNAKTPLPRSGRSRNAVTGDIHPGISVYEGVLVEPDLFRIDTNPLTIGGVGGLIGHAAADFAAFFVNGEEVGRGADGEPLLRVARIWPMPKACALTSIETLAQPALRLWSRGPRDGSGFRHIRWRLAPPSDYSPDLEFNLSHRVFGHGRGRNNKKKRRAKKR